MPPHRLTLEQAADFLNMDVAELNSLAVQGEIPCHQQGRRFFFDQDAIDAWCSIQLIDEQNDHKRNKKKRKERHPSREDSHPAGEERHTLSELCRKGLMEPALAGKSKSSVLTSLVELAEETGFLFNPQDLYAELIAREEESPTTLRNGVALPHPRRRLEIPLFDESFACVAKLQNPVFFGAEFGEQKTDILFLVCCLDSQLHLETLARICVLCQEPSFLQALREAETPEEMLDVITRMDENPQAFSQLTP